MWKEECEIRDRCEGISFLGFECVVTTVDTLMLKAYSAITNSKGKPLHNTASIPQFV